MKNLFIAIEGTDGSGKSTQARLLAQRLTENGHRVYSTFEPTNGTIGRLLRSILKGEEKADQRAIAALFLADRLDHITHEADGLLKKLEEGYTVICDRYYFSSYAYHSLYVDMDWVIDCNRICTSMLRPDITLFLDVPVDVCMQRIAAGRQSTELYETAEILTQVRANYLRAMEKLTATEVTATIDGTGAMQEISGRIWEAISELS